MGKRQSLVRRITAADQFCGAGGFSTGLRWAIGQIEREQGRPVDLRLVAINHWELAIDTHKANHPDVDHICDELENANPRHLFPDGKLRLLISSPECTHFSRALGGKPKNWQSRATSKYVVKWASQLDVQDIIIENVREFRDWGPLHRSGAHAGKPVASRKGQFFRAFVRKLEALGYRVEHRLLVCADYGDATSRQRLFIRARKGGGPITWPAITHAPAAKAKQMSRGLGRPIAPYQTARDIIDWDDMGTSIFNRTKPLADNTLRRIFAGLRKFSGLPFVVPYHNERAGQAPRSHSVDAPIPTITTQRTPLLVQPFVFQMEHSTDASGHDRRVFSPDQPLQTITTRAAIGLARPFVLKLYGTSTADPVSAPLATVTAGGQHLGVVQPFVLGQQSGAAPRATDEPLPTVAGAGAISLIQPFLLQMEHGKREGVMAVSDPMRTITSADGWGLAQPFILPVNHGAGEMRTHSIDDPMRTITSVDAWGLAQPFLVKFYATGDGQAVSDPLGTVTTRDRFALCVPVVGRAGELGHLLIDIYFRMLKPIELARAHSMGHYVFRGSRENVVKQIGNGVPSKTAQNLCYSALMW